MQPSGYALSATPRRRCGLNLPWFLRGGNPFVTFFHHAYGVPNSLSSVLPLSTTWATLLAFPVHPSAPAHLTRLLPSPRTTSKNGRALLCPISVFFWLHVHDAVCLFVSVWLHVSIAVGLVACVMLGLASWEISRKCGSTKMPG